MIFPQLVNGVKSIYIDSMNEAYLLNPVSKVVFKIPEWPGKTISK